MSVYFVTGATGAVGSALVPMLLEDPAAQVHLLIRAPNGETLGRRVDDLFRFWDLGEQEQDYRSRIRAMRGDAAEPQFGLDDDAYTQLTGSVNRIVHAAGAVRMNLPIEEARRSAVTSAQRIIDLAHVCQQQGVLEKIEFVSTVGVGGRLPQVPEDWITTPRVFHNTYEQAKAEAEGLIRGHLDKGLPITVHRPSMVVGHSRTGKIIHYQIFYHLCEFLSGQRTLGLFPPLGNAGLDIVPVDYVARVLAWSSTRPDMAGRILHECAGREGAVSLTELRSRVRALFSSHGRRVPPVVTLPTWAFRGLLALVSHFLSEQDRRAVRTLPVFLDYLASPQVFQNLHTRALLTGEGESLPGYQAYFDVVMDGYLAQLGLPRNDEKAE